ncbi:MAG: hypothetical protein JOZ98_11535 [Solirubrobacterales bacterium]|nr:hypothetical protein [Solirubrobacterales bacterium]MBV9423536.1 hypothetical protein [Solirubrobacterales bacterium]MBV9798900.1 hypothetical protein [Solirubrobacterales bacterium]
MAETSKVGHLLERLSQGVAAHDRENPEHHTWGIGMAYFDIERLGLEEGEEILPGIVLRGDGGMTGQFRILCDGQHDGSAAEEEEEAVDAVAEQEVPAEPLPARPVTPPL